MKPSAFSLPILVSALVIAVGCRSGTQQNNPHRSTSSGSTLAASDVSGDTAKAQATAEAADSHGIRLPIRIKAGASAIKDSAGNEWTEDTGFSGGDVIERPDLPIANTKEPELYQSEHYAMNSFGYKLPNGRYQVKLHFCETFEGISGPGERVFSFDVEGKPFNDFDVWAKAGGFAKALVETVDVDVTDGQLNINFIAKVENPQINAIEIHPARP